MIVLSIRFYKNYKEEIGEKALKQSCYDYHHKKIKTNQDEIKRHHLSM